MDEDEYSKPFKPRPRLNRDESSERSFDSRESMRPIARRRSSSSSWVDDNAGEISEPYSDARSLGEVRSLSRKPKTRDGLNAKLISSREDLTSEVTEIHNQAYEMEEMETKSYHSTSPAEGTSPSAKAESIREQVRNRFQKAKEKVEQHSQETKGRTRLKDLRKRAKSSTRFDEILEENKSIYQAVRAAVNKPTGDAAKEFGEAPTKEEAYDFFTKEWEENRDIPYDVPELYPSLSKQLVTPAPTIPQPLKAPIKNMWDWIKDLFSTPAPPRVTSVAKPIGTPQQVPDYPPQPSELEKYATEHETEAKVLEPEKDVDEVDAKEQESPGDEKEDGGKAVQEDNGQTPPVVTQTQEELPAKISSHDLIPKMDHLQLYENWPPIYVSKNIRIDWEKYNYYIPSVNPVPLEQKLTIEAPRNEEDEGIYVGEKPPLTPRNKNKIENRLVVEGRLGFFDKNLDVMQNLHPDATTYVLPPTDVCEEYMTVVESCRERTTAETERYQLDVSVANVTFQHHHMFSTEHVLASKVVALAKKYTLQMNQDRIAVFSYKLDALRAAVTSILENIEGEDQFDDNVKIKLIGYIREIRNLRRQKDDDDALNRSLLKNLLNHWKQLKELRTRQGHSKTMLKLKLNKVESDPQVDEIQWKKDIQNEFEEEKLIYKIASKIRAAWKRRKKKKKMQHDENGDSESEDEDELSKLPGKELLPTKFNRKDVMDAIQAKALANRRRPGESKLLPVITNYSVAVNENIPDSEQQRIAHLAKIKVFIRIIFNGKEVCKTELKSISSDFVVRFGQMYNLQIFQKPETIILQIFETTSWSSFSNVALLASVAVPIPNANVTSNRAEFDDLEFSSSAVVEHKHAGVGSGIAVNYELGSNATDVLCTSGIVKCCASWGLDSEGNSLAPPSHFFVGDCHDRRDKLVVAGRVNREHLTRWLQEAQVDPNDPANESLLPFLTVSGQIKMAEKPKDDYFRLDHLQEEFNFVSDDYIQSNPRFRLLRLRAEEVPEFQNLTMIPMFESEILPDIFEEYEKRLADEQKPIPPDDVEAHRMRIDKYMNKVCEQVMRHFHELHHRKSMNCIIIEEQVPDISTLSLTMLNLREPRHPLRPIRKARKKIPTQFAGAPDLSILITVVRGFNVPIRRESEQRTSRRRPNMTSVLSSASPRIKIPEPLVNPLVEVSFQRTVIKTSAASGPNPTWNQSIRIPYKVPGNDVSPNNLHKIKDVLYLNLFDDVRVDILEDERDRDVRIHQRIERHWLGVLKIPYTTLYFNSRIEGTFKIESPPVLLGYVWNSEPTIYSIEDGLFNLDATYISLFITLDPVLSIPEPLIYKFQSDEPHHLHDYAKKWTERITATFPRRLVKTSAVNFQGSSVFLTRYLKPLNPPPELLDLNAPTNRTMEVLARYVSLIPRRSNNTLVPGVCDLWTTSDQLLQMMCGSEEEHAVLLCNYFLFLKQQAWLALGFAVPEGPTAYVLTAGENTYWLWRSTTGENFDIRDSLCPLIGLDCLVNENNIWANVQSYYQPSRLSMDMKNTNAWQPFFTKKFSNPGLKSVQPEQLVYVPTKEAFVQSLQEKIERTLREKLMLWRSRHRTPWNRHCGHTLQKLLPKFEIKRCHHQDDILFQEELQEILTAYKMNGFPLDFSYTDIETILESVYTTGLHTFEREDLEFALAIYVHPYPNNVLAVWIYLATLLKR